MIKYQVSQVIKRPVEEVFAYVTNPENDAQWKSGIEDSHWTSDDPVGVGSTGQAIFRSLRRMELKWVVTEYEPNRKFSFKATFGPFAVQANNTFEAVGSGTMMNVAMQGEGFLKVVDPIMAPIVKRQNRAEYRKLKDLLEAQMDRYVVVDKDNAKRGFLIQDTETGRFPLLTTSGKKPKERAWTERLAAAMNADGTLTAEEKRRFQALGIERVDAEVFRCSECNATWIVTRSGVNRPARWWLCPNGHNLERGEARIRQKSGRHA